MLTLNFLGFGYVFLRAATTTTSTLAIAGLALNAVPWLFYLLNKKHLHNIAIAFALLVSAVLWVYWSNIFMGGMLAIFALMGFYANRKTAIQFTKEGIIYPSFPTKKYAWNEVESILLKDDILTIDLKNNQFLQFHIDAAIAAPINTASFNDWCIIQMKP